MKTMLFYELKKMLTVSKIVIISIVTVIFCCAVFFGYSASIGNVHLSVDEARAAQEYAEGELTQEKIELYEKKAEEIRSNPDNYDSEDLKEEAQKEQNKIFSVLYLEYPLRLKAELISELNTELSNPDISKNEKILVERNIEMLSNRGNIYGGYNSFYDFYENFLHNFAPYLLGFIIIFLTAPIFSTEYATKMDGLILSSRNGKRKIIFSKFLAGGIAVTAVFFLATGLYALLAGGFLGFDGEKTSLCTLYSFLESPYDLNLLQYTIISLAISYFACIGLMVFVMFLSSVSRGNLMSSIISLVVFYVPLLFYAMSNGRDEMGGIINFTYGRIMQVAPMFDRFTGYVAFGNVFMLKELLLASLALATVVFSILSYRSFRRHQAGN